MPLQAGPLSEDSQSSPIYAPMLFYMQQRYQAFTCYGVLVLNLQSQQVSLTFKPRDPLQQKIFSLISSLNCNYKLMQHADMQIELAVGVCS